MKYIIPLEGYGAPDDPIRPKYRPVKERKEVKRGDKTEKVSILYPARVDLSSGVAVIESEEKIKALEGKKDVKKE